MTNLVLNLLAQRCAGLLDRFVAVSAVAVRGGIVVQGESAGLYFSLLPDAPLFFITDQHFDNDGEQAFVAGRIGAPLAGYRFSGIDKQPSDRTIRFAFHDDAGNGLFLFYEAIPRRVDLVLCDAAGAVLARVRPSRDGADHYIPMPQPEAECDLFSSAEDRILETIVRAAGSADALVHDLRGGDPWLARELIARHRAAPEQAVTMLSLLRAGAYALGIFETEPDAEPLLLPALFSQAATGIGEEFDDANEAAQVWFRAHLRIREREELAAEIGQAIARQRKRTQGTLGKLAKDLAASERHENFSHTGDLILANVHRIKRGAASVTVENFYDPDGGEIGIDLDPALDPAANADRYYDKARRARRGVEQIAQRQRVVGRDLEGIETLAARLETIRNDYRALRALQKELISRRWITQAQRRKLKVTRKPGNRYLSSDGLEIVVGRSSTENEIVTFQVGRDNDFWMHAAGNPGSHVVIRNPQKRAEPPAATLEEAAALAAYYSKARNSSNVQVHWTIRRHVKKLKGGPPGTVLLGIYQSILVKPAIPPGVRYVE